MSSAVELVGFSCDELRLVSVKVSCPSFQHTHILESSMEEFYPH
jgi:hypothetical protein